MNITQIKSFDNFDDHFNPAFLQAIPGPVQNQASKSRAQFISSTINTAAPYVKSGVVKTAQFTKDACITAAPYVKAAAVKTAQFTKDACITAAPYVKSGVVKTAQFTKDACITAAPYVKQAVSAIAFTIFSALKSAYSTAAPYVKQGFTHTGALANELAQGATNYFSPDNFYPTVQGFVIV